MTASDTGFVLGIDGGATKSLGLLADLDGKVLVRREAGPSNQMVIGAEAAARNIVGLMNECCAAAGCQPVDLRFAVLGLAGAGNAPESEVLHRTIKELLDRNGHGQTQFSIETDVTIALEGAFDGKSGIVAIACTGSAVLGKTPSGAVVGAGGWGRSLGDEGGGYSLGREALRAAARELDGMGSSGALLALLGSRRGLDTRDRIIRAVYRDQLDIASLAPLVLEGAGRGDAVCKDILERAASSLADQVSTVFARLAVHGETGVVLLGGLVDHESAYSRILSVAIQRRSPALQIRTARRSPAEGAVLMALRRAKKG